jgi:hypothetical protein
VSEIPEDFDYRIEVDKMLLAARFLADLDLASILRAIEQAHTIGPFIDPTAYRDSLYRGHMDIVRDLAASLVEPARIFRERVAPTVGVPA